MNRNERRAQQARNRKSVSKPFDMGAITPEEAMARMTGTGSYGWSLSVLDNARHAFHSKATGLSDSSISP